MQPNNNGNPNPQPPIWQQPPPLYPAPPAPPLPSTEPQLPEPQSQSSEPVYAPAVPQGRSSRQRLLLRIIALIVAALVAMILYVAFVRGTDGAPTDGQSNVKQSPMSSLQGASLLPPADLSRYQPNSGNSGTHMEYKASQGGCSLKMGVADSEAMPGKDFNAMVDVRLKQYRDNKLNIDGPKKADDFTLLNAADSTKGYSLQSITYTIKQKDSSTNVRFSAAILKNKQRAYVIRSCEGKDDAAKATTLDAIDKDARTASVIAE